MSTWSTISNPNASSTTLVKTSAQILTKPQIININITGLKPNTTHYCFWRNRICEIDAVVYRNSVFTQRDSDGVFASSVIKTDDVLTYGTLKVQNLKSSSSGTLSLKGYWNPDFSEGEVDFHSAISAIDMNSGDNYFFVMDQFASSIPSDSYQWLSQGIQKFREKSGLGIESYALYKFRVSSTSVITNKYTTKLIANETGTNASNTATSSQSGSGGSGGGGVFKHNDYHFLDQK